MVPALFFSQVVLIALVWLCLTRHGMWPSDPAPGPPTPAPTPPMLKPHRAHKSLTGLTTQPHGDACTPASDLHLEAPRHPAACPPGGAAARWTPPPHRRFWNAPKYLSA